jgi:hypothetical protein
VPRLEAPDRSGRTTPAGVFSIRSWTSFKPELSLTSRVLHAAGQLLDRTEHDGAAKVRQMATLLERVPPAPPSWTSVTDLPPLLADL